ncbi:MAG TPA: HAD family hydrolase [Frateuria sp.]|uniref:HAD family hydrolase n=1 Tax=Frateuria sp. TaxID=2211372 RepID=UPI002DEDBE03|nr:HAD family hydrolase [Frateuria sp.]
MQHKIKAVAFDAFGTLVEIHDKRRPYARLAKAAALPLARSPMCEPIDLDAMTHLCGLALDAREMDILHEDLQAELASTQPYPEAREVLEELKRLGLRTAVASNLALPYARPIEAQLGALLDVSCMSFEVGFEKPDGGFYEALCRRLQLLPQEVLMIGDTWRCDYEGATAAGLHAVHLDRQGKATADQRHLSTTSLLGVLSWLKRE